MECEPKHLSILKFILGKKMNPTFRNYDMYESLKSKYIDISKIIIVEDAFSCLTFTNTPNFMKVENEKDTIFVIG